MYSDSCNHLPFPNLSKTGPVVWEIPAGQTVGIVMDYWQRPLADIGLTGGTRVRPDIEKLK